MVFRSGVQLQDPSAAVSTCQGNPFWLGEPHGPKESRMIATHLPSAGHFPTKSTSASWMSLSCLAGLTALSIQPHPRRPLLVPLQAHGFRAPTLDRGSS